MKVEIKNGLGCNSIKFKLIDNEIILDKPIIVNSSNRGRNDLLNVLFQLGYIESIYVNKISLNVVFRDLESFNDESNKVEILNIINNYLTNVGPIKIESFIKPNIDFSSLTNEILDTDSNEIKSIKEILNKYIIDAIEADGGFLKFNKLENNIIHLYMGGACSGCGAQDNTIESIKTIFKHFISPNIITNIITV